MISPHEIKYWLKKLKISRAKSTFILDTLKAKYFYFTEKTITSRLQKNEFRILRRLKGGSSHSHDINQKISNSHEIVGHGDFRFLAKKYIC